jgi:hypothetical protein
MRKKERKGPGMATSSSEDEDWVAVGSEDCAPDDCCEGVAGAALQGTQENMQRKIVRRNADRQ